MVQISKKLAEGQRAYPFGKGKGMTAGVNDIQSVQPEVGKKERARYGTPIFLSTHSLEIAEELCDLIAII